jgi:plasmid stability protein
MATLYVREIPDDVYQAAKDIAAERNLSLNAYFTALLNEAVEREAQRAKAKQAMENIKKRRRKLPKGAPTAVEIIRGIRNSSGGIGAE